MIRLSRAACALLGVVCALTFCQYESKAQNPPKVGNDKRNQPPVIVSLTAVQVPGAKFRVYGSVADETPSTCGIIITGVFQGVIPCDRNGNFDGTFPSSPGECTAVAGDGELTSAPMPFMLMNLPPTIGGFTAVAGPGNSWTFSGTVGDEAPSGLTVTLTGPPGVNGQTATVNANGSWSITLTLPAGTGGNVTATVTDWFGVQASAYTSF